jgi:hypothetical protein
MILLKMKKVSGKNFVVPESFLFVAAVGWWEGGGGAMTVLAEVTHLALPVDPDDSVARIVLSGHKNGVRAE